METEFFSIICDVNNLRLDQYLADQMEGFSRTRIKAMITNGLISVSGKSEKPSYRLKTGDIIEGEIPPLSELEINPVNIPLNIVYEDNELIVINKPKDMVVHPAPGHFNDTLVNALLYHLGDSLSGINGVMRPGIVHRIDKDTTGLIVAAKSDMAHISLSEQLKEHKVERTYHAIVFGALNEKEGVIDAPVGRHPKDRLKMSVNYKNGKNAITRYKIIEAFRKYTYMEANLETGRTHQIRVHMSHLGHPVLGDTVYSSRKQPFKTEGQVLHAKTLGFIHPRTGEHMLFNSELPSYFKQLLENPEVTQ